MKKTQKYPAIPAYSKYMGSYQYWTDSQLAQAAAINAPADTYRVEDGKAFTLSELPTDSMTYSYFAANHPEMFTQKGA